MGAEFIVDEGALTGLVLALGEGESWTIGRDPEQCALLLEDPEIDRVQFRCYREEDDYFLENLSTTRAIVINGQLLEGTQLLSDGDRIEIGRTALTFFSEEERPRELMVLQREEEDEDFQTEAQRLVAEAFTENSVDEDPIAEEEPMAMFEPEEEFHLDLTPSSRFILKVIGGPNTGAEFVLDLGKEYLIGTDTTTCDIIFHDLSVSHHHARLVVSAEGEVTIEDLESRNGVVIDQKKITEPVRLGTQSIVILGTSSFLLIDKEAPQETIATPLMEPIVAESVQEEEELAPVAFKEEAPTPFVIPPHFFGALILGCIVLGFSFLLGCGIFALSRTKEATIQAPGKDMVMQVQEALKPFPGVRHTFNRTTRQLFLVGHVVSSVDNSELDYNLQALTFLRGVQNNIVNDEAIWQEMNLLLSKHPDFKGVNMHSPAPGVFVLSGYLKTDAQEANLVDYLNINFNYLNLLDNRVVVEQEVADEVASRLMQQGFSAVTSLFLNGDLALTGYIGTNQASEFEQLVAQLQQIPGVRHVQNYVVVVTIDQQVVDLSLRYPGRYTVTGYSKHGDVNINVVMNGKIVMRGDAIDGMTIMGIQAHAVLLEKDGLKYKIEYNK